MTFGKILAGLIILLLSLFAVAWWRSEGIFRPAIENTPVVAFDTQPEAEPLRVIVRELFSPVSIATSSEAEEAGEVAGSNSPSSNAELLQQCEDGECEPLQAEGVSTSAVTDGKWWYYYESAGEDSRGFTKVYLRRTNPNSEQVETIMESTPLTSPRGLFLSPNRNHLAFWLDNADDEEEQLTELWVYDIENGSIRVVAEQLFLPDVRSTVRWNSSSNYLWFIADTGEQEDQADQLEIILVDIIGRTKRADFGSIPWQRYLEKFGSAPMDLDRQGSRLALVGINFFRQENLDILGPGQAERTSLRGSLPFIQWLLSGDLLYAVQDSAGFSFWQRDSKGLNQLVARQPGQLLSARSDTSGEYITFVIRQDGQVQVRALQISSGAILEAGQFTSRPETNLQILHVEKITEQYGRPLVSRELDDAELAAVIDSHAPDIVGEDVVQPYRLIMTDQVNTLYFDYYDDQVKKQRILLQVRDIIYNEWKVLARFESVNAAWQLVEGNDEPKPTPLRLYEWEQPPGQWILKEAFGEG